MASSCCWRCFSQLRPSPRALLTPQAALPLRTRTIAAAPFHTTAAQYAAPPKKSKGSYAASGPKFRESRSSKIKKKKRTSDKSRRLPPADRKAVAQKIVLSNNNALEVTEMKDMSVENMTDVELKGTVVGVPMPLVDRLRTVQAFKTSQSWSLFHRPGALVRKETLELGRVMERVESGRNTGKEMNAFATIVTGDKKTGKSIHLLQATTMAFLHEWVVISIPNASDLVSGRSAYAPLRDSNPVQYVQKNITAQLLESIVEANKDILSKLHISQAHPSLRTQLPSDTSLYELGKVGIRQPDIAWPAFQALWSELTAKQPAADNDKMEPFKTRPPLLVTIDNLAHLMKNSEYRDTEYNPIHAHDFTLVKHFLSLTQHQSLQSSLPNGGLVLYSTSASNSPSIPSLKICLEQLAARSAGVSPTSSDFPLPPPYEKLDERVMQYFSKSKSLGIQKLAGLNKDEAKGLLEYYARSGLVRERIDENFVGEKWTLSGGGIIGELDQLGRRLRALPLA